MATTSILIHREGRRKKSDSYLIEWITPLTRRGGAALVGDPSATLEKRRRWKTDGGWGVGEVSETGKLRKPAGEATETVCSGGGWWLVLAAS